MHILHGFRILCEIAKRTFDISQKNWHIHRKIGILLFSYNGINISESTSNKECLQHVHYFAFLGNDD